MTPRTCLPLLAVVAAGALAAPAAAGDFRTRANDSCARYARAADALPEVTSAAEWKRQLVLVPKLFRTMVDQVAAAPAPQAQRAQAARLVAALRRVQLALGRIRDAVLGGDQAGVDAAIRSGTSPSRAAARTAKALGLPACARLAATAAKGPRP